MRRAEILDAQDDQRYGEGKLGSELSTARSGRAEGQAEPLEKIRQARKEMEAETAAAAAR